MYKKVVYSLGYIMSGYQTVTWFTIYTGLFFFLQRASSTDVNVFISVKSNSDRPQIKRIPGNPDTWTKSVQAKGNLSLYTTRGRPGKHLFEKLAFHYRKSVVFYSDGQQKDIQLMLQHSGRQRILAKHVHTSAQVGGVAVDWISNNVYWTDQIYNWIMMVCIESESNDFKRVIHTDLDVPGNIKVYPSLSYLFWTDYGKHPKIERSDLLGGQRTILVKNVSKPMALEIDYNTQHIYWVDIGKQVIARSDFNGQNILTFIQESFVSSLIAISIYENHMFGVSSSDGSVYLMSLSTHSHHRAWMTNIRQSYDVTTISEKSQPYQSSPCEDAVCSDLCVGRRNNTEAECACPWGKKLVSDTLCQDKDDLAPPVYLFVNDSTLCSYNVWMPDDSNRNPECHMDLMGDVLAFDFWENNLFIGGSDSITKLDWSHRKLSVIRTGESHISAISVNWVTKYLYWTTGDGDIMSATTSGTDVSTLISSLQGLFGVVVNPFRRVVYWSCRGDLPTIGQVMEDGTARNDTFITHSVKRPGHLTFDFATKRLYWTDSALGTIESVSEEGSDRQTIFSDSTGINGIALYQDYVLWTDNSEQSPGIGWAYKNRKESKLHKTELQDVGPTVILYGDYSQPNYTQYYPAHYSTQKSTQVSSGTTISVANQHSVSGKPVVLTVIAIAACIIIILVVVSAGYIYRRHSHRLRFERPTSDENGQSPVPVCQYAVPEYGSTECVQLMRNDSSDNVDAV